MNRRELLKAVAPLVGIPLMVKGEEIGKAIKTELNAKYIVFINVESGIVINEFCRTAPLPPGTWVHMIYPGEKGMDEAIRIYETK